MVGNEIKITVSPDGTELTGLYVDDFRWEALGSLSIKRATDMKFSKKFQRWVVHVLDEGGRILDTGHVRRSDALKAEVDYLQERGII